MNNIIKRFVETVANKLVKDVHGYNFSNDGSINNLNLLDKNDKTVVLIQWFGNTPIYKVVMGSEGYEIVVDKKLDLMERLRTSLLEAITSYDADAALAGYHERT